MIVFEKPIEQDRIRMAFNNHVIRFKSDSPLLANYCDIVIVGITGIVENVTLRLYPNPQNSFYFNFKPYVSTLISSLGFEDTIATTELTANDADSFVYNAANGTFLQKTVHINIALQDGTDGGSYVLEWLGGVEQIGAEHTFKTNDYFVLSPFKKLSPTTFYLKYWQGYPFDIGIFNREPQFYLDNTTTLFSQGFTTPFPPPGIPAFLMPGLRGPVTRLFFSDGRTDETLEDLLPLIEGYNTLRLKTSTANNANDKIIHLEKVSYKCGVYLKWLNAMGGYSYWLFENTYSVDRTTKSLGELDRDMNNADEIFARAVQVGKESQDNIKIVAELLTEDERTIVEGMLDSPKIYLFTGQPFSRNSYRNWIEVNLKTTSARIKNPRQPLTNFTFDIELPARYSQTL